MVQEPQPGIGVKLRVQADDSVRWKEAVKTLQRWWPVSPAPCQPVLLEIVCVVTLLLRELE